MKFRTEFNITPLTPPIDLSEGVFSIGSCFSERIADRMKRLKFKTTSNPYGVLFNPQSIANAIERISTLKAVATDEVELGKEGWFHFDMHSKFSSRDKSETLRKIDAATNSANSSLKNAKHVIITFGSAVVYELRDSGRVVANCHKEPQSRFNKKLLSISDIVSGWSKIIEQYLSDKHLIFTLSPVRHIADSAPVNSLSKATLRCAIAELCNRFQNADYFPSYELLMDDLRDYRFYAEDLVHPSNIAIDYIWERFCEAALSPRAKRLLPKIEDIITASEHRPLHPQSDSFALFKERYAALSQQLYTEENIPLEREIAYFNSKELSK